MPQVLERDGGALRRDEASYVARDGEEGEGQEVSVGAPAGISIRLGYPGPLCNFTRWWGITVEALEYEAFGFGAVTTQSSNSEAAELRVRLLVSLLKLKITHKKILNIVFGSPTLCTLFF